MRIIFLTLFAVMILQPALYASSVIIDCGEGFIGVTVQNQSGIPTVECRRLWCRDLENGRPMGSGDRPNNGYDNTAVPEEICGGNDCISCFGRRRWCQGESAGIWEPEAGMYVRSNEVVSPGSPILNRGVLSGNCFRWQLQAHGCGPNQVAYNDGTAWICLTPSQLMGVGDRGATVPRAIRRAPTIR